ncbi:unnamed protein product [Hymenolepis diminuta]|uniref:Uncharacterized protein n=1 Tax=Hymenolepis diminuta TaxID=6216 RepID=A0A564YIL0_HYMDI|nr:unnamed protein product [Hymenolepis diminuta]
MDYISAKLDKVAGLILMGNGIKNILPSSNSGPNVSQIWIECCYIIGGFMALSTPFINAYGYAKQSIKIISNNCKIVCPVSCLEIFTAMVALTYPDYYGWSIVAIITAIFNMLGALGTTLMIADDEYIEPHTT